MMHSLDRCIKDIIDKESEKTLIRKTIFFKNPLDEWEYRVAYFFSPTEADYWIKARCEEYEALGLDYMVETAVVDFKNN